MIAVQNNDVVLIKISTKDGMKFPPYSIWYVATALKKAGYTPHMFHIYPEQLDDTLEKIKTIDPLWVGFSTFTADSMHANADLSRMVKDAGYTTVWGGIHPSLCPDQCAQEDYVDYVCVGEGEETSIDITRMTRGEMEPDEVMGLVYQKDDGSVHHCAGRPVIKNIDEYWFDWDLYDITQYFRPYWGDRQKVFHVITSRGCPFKCGFCYIASSTDYRKWRGHSDEVVIRTIQEFRDKYGVDGVFFQDDNFAVKRKRALKIVGDIDIPSFFEIRADNIDDEFAAELSKTKTREIFMGLESGSDRILDLVTKDATVADMRNAVEAMSKYPDIMLSISIIYGYPGENWDECVTTFGFVDDMLKLKPNMSITGGFFIPYPGAPLFDNAVEMGYVPPAKTEDWDALDRWGDYPEDLELTWSPFMTVRKAAQLRRLLQITSFAYKFNVPLLKTVCSAKMRQADGSRHWLVEIVTRFRSVYNRKLYNFRFMRSLKHVMATLGIRKAHKDIERRGTATA